MHVFYSGFCFHAAFFSFLPTFFHSFYPLLLQEGSEKPQGTGTPATLLTSEKPLGDPST